MAKVRFTKENTDDLFVTSSQVLLKPKPLWIFLNNILESKFQMSSVEGPSLRLPTPVLK